MKKRLFFWGILAAALYVFVTGPGRMVAEGPFEFRPKWPVLIPAVAIWTSLLGLVIRKRLKAAEFRTRKQPTGLAPAHANASLVELAVAQPALARLWNDRAGTSFIETAILIPALLMMCCGTMDFARVVYAGVEIASAARAGVQYGALTPGNSGNTAGMVSAALTDAADLGASVTATATNFCTCAGATVACSSTCSGATPDGYVSVTANYTFNTVLPYPGLPQSVALTRTAKMRVQ